MRNHNTEAEPISRSAFFYALPGLKFGLRAAKSEFA
jgi:hypothetical protein